MSQLLHPTRRAQDAGPLPGSLVCHNVHLVMSAFFFFFFFFFTVRYASRVPVPPSTKLTPHPTCTTSPTPQHLPFQAAQTVKPASCRRSVQNCRSPKPNAIALLLSTHPQHTRVEDIDGRVGGGGGGWQRPREIQGAVV